MSDIAWNDGEYFPSDDDEPDEDVVTRAEPHVMPVDDLVEHEDNEDCVCGPTPMFVSGGIYVVHHSLDGREQFEPDAR